MNNSFEIQQSMSKPFFVKNLVEKFDFDNLFPVRIREVIYMKAFLVLDIIYKIKKNVSFFSTISYCILCLNHRIKLVIVTDVLFLVYVDLNCFNS